MEATPTTDSSPTTAAPGPEHNAPDPSGSEPAPAKNPFSRSRRGTVARLPKILRDRINQMLDDGLSYAHIIRELGSDANGLATTHISSWKTGGYQDYLRQQQRLDQCRPSHDLLATFASQCQGTESYQAAPKIAAALLCETFIDLGPETIRRALEQNPMNAFRLLNALARILSGGLRSERFLAQKAQHDATAAAAEPVKGLKPQTFGQINDKLRLL